MKTIFLTGANRGLGLGFAEKFLTRGDRVFATCRDIKSADALLALQKSYPQTLHIFTLEVMDDSSIEQVITYLRKEGVVFDWVLHNAGILGEDAYGEFSREDMRRVFEVNTISPLALTQALYPFIKKEGGGLVMNMSSLLGSLERASDLDWRGISYPVSKAALNMVTTMQARQYAPDKITVISMSPGWARTDMGGQEAPLSIEESVTAMIKTLDHISFAETGKFINLDGTTLPW